MAMTGDGGTTLTPEEGIQEITERIREIIADQLMVDVKEVTNEKSFIGNLGADSIDVIELIMEFDDKFGTEISDEKAEELTTVGKAIAYLGPILLKKQNAS